MNTLFQPATKTKSRLRMALMGPSGSGKTFTALRIAHNLADGGKIAVVDTENGSASKYVGESPDGTPWAFDTLQLSGDYHPDRFLEAIQGASQAGYAVLVIDGLSPAWNGPGGMLELVDRAAKRSRSGNSFAAWKDVKPIERKLWDGIVNAGVHLIATFRTKTEWVIEEDRRGKKAPKKIGTKAEQREGLEYEFDVVGEVDIDHNLVISKTRCTALDGAVIAKAGPEIAETLTTWLTDGAEPPAPPPKPAPEWLGRAQSDAAAKGIPWDAIMRHLGKTTDQLVHNDGQRVRTAMGELADHRGEE